ncbi:MAG: hypothetical protein AAGD38_21615, partial [Acidobacteriota bacterium]
MSKYVGTFVLALFLVTGLVSAEPGDAWLEIHPGVWQVEENTRSTIVADGVDALPWIRAHFEHRTTVLLERYLAEPSNELWNAVTNTVTHAKEAEQLLEAGGPELATRAAVQTVNANALWGRWIFWAFASAAYEDKSVSADIDNQATAIVVGAPDGGPHTC